MDEDYQWFWSMTKLESQILSAGYDIVAIRNHEDMLHHFGGRSGDDWRGARGMDVEMDHVLSWFKHDENAGDDVEKRTGQVLIYETLAEAQA